MYFCTVVKHLFILKQMENHFIAGNTYTKEEIESKGYTLTKQTTILVFYRKDDDLLAFDVPKPLKPNSYKLISISKD